MSKLFEAIYNAVFVQNRYMSILEGLKNTLIIAFFATILGVIIGTIVALVKHACYGKKSLWLMDKICDIYITIIRGTPVVIQLLILSTVIFQYWNNAIMIAIIGFGLNSGAYVAEIIRAGILAVDRGQMEAGRSLGLTRGQTMRKIIMPQAIKNILPALGNEFITLLKETSIAGYLAVHDLTKSGEVIKATTYDGTIFFIVGLVYLVLVVGLTAILKRFERRLAKSDRG
jgi:His/Glu/Gln/Arg/opine family amino acid ABC transporter permease subunit